MSGLGQRLRQDPGWTALLAEEDAARPLSPHHRSQLCVVMKNLAADGVPASLLPAIQWWLDPSQVQL